jgi:hypothetical protein
MRYSKDFKPEWERKKEEEEKKKQDAIAEALNPNNFPTLGMSVAKTNGWSGKKFSELASEWNEKTELEKTIENGKSKTGSLIEDTYQCAPISLPKFNNIGRFIEPDDDTYTESESPPNVEEREQMKSEEDNWVTVTRKVRTKKSVLTMSDEELQQRDPSEEEFTEDTVWDQKETHELYWNEPV